MDATIVLAVFPIIFIGELPDKTMFASVVMASRGNPFGVWMGAAAAFVVHVVIATTVGVAVFTFLPHRVVEAVVTVAFTGAAVWAWKESGRDETELVTREVAAHRRVVPASFLVIFIAEWGDLTQILTANLAAHYHSALSVGLGAVLALWAVAGLAVVGGKGLLRFVSIATLRRITALVLCGIALFSAWSTSTA